MEDYLIVAISSEGTVRAGSGDTIKMELADILKGEYLAPHVSIWHYKLDELEEVSDPSTWLKANPNLGATISYETYHLDVERAEKSSCITQRHSSQAFWDSYGGLHIFLHFMKRLFRIVQENSGSCRVLSVQISHKVTISVLLHFCFHWGMNVGESKLEATSLLSH